MELINKFTVAVPVDKAWDVLLDVPRIAPCMPGASLTSFDGEQFQGTVKVKLGPVNLTYAGQGRFVARDAEQRRMVIEASGKDSRGTSTAAATVTGTLQAVPEGTVVRVVTELHITGAPARYGRGMIADVASRLTGQFADCLAQTLGEEPAPAPVPPIDLVTARRAIPYVITFLAGVVVGAVLYRMFA